MLNSDCRDIILNRRCRADERGLFLSLPLIHLFNFVEEYGSNKVDLIIYGHTNIGDSDIGQFHTEFYPGDYYFNHNGQYTDRVLLVSKCVGYTIDGKNTKMGLYLKLNYIDNTIDFYDSYYCKELELDELLLDNSEEVHIPFYLGAMYGNKISSATESTLHLGSVTRFYELDIDTASNVVKGVISETDCMFSLHNSIVINNDMSIRKYIKYADELIDRFEISQGNIINPISRDNSNFMSYLRTREIMKEVRLIDQKNHKTHIYDRIFIDLEDISEVQKSISDDVKKRKELIEELTIIQNELFKSRFLIKSKKIENYKKNNECKYYSSICLLIKNENNYLKEWLDHYDSIGCDHFYIFDNGSDFPVQEFLKTIDNGKYVEKCTVVDFSKGYKHMQYDCYDLCLRMFGKESFWIGFVDTDEFVDVTCGDLNKFLKEYEDNFCVWIPWEVYNSNGHVRKQEGLQKDLYTKPIINPQGMFGKVFLQPFRTKKMYVHLAVGIDKFERSVNTNNDDHLLTTLATRNKYYAGDQSIYEHAKCRHYFTRSLEEWMDKINRGSCDPNFCRKFNTYFDFNPDMKNNTEALNYLMSIKDMAQFMQGYK